MFVSRRVTCAESHTKISVCRVVFSIKFFGRSLRQRQNGRIDSRSATLSIMYLKVCVIFAAMAGATRGWDLGSGLKYKLTTTLLFSETAPSKSGGDVGFRLTGELDVTAVWQRPDDSNSFLLKIQVRILFDFHLFERN